MGDAATLDLWSAGGGVPRKIAPPGVETITIDTAALADWIQGAQLGEAIVVGAAGAAIGGGAIALTETILDAGAIVFEDSRWLVGVTNGCDAIAGFDRNDKLDFAEMLESDSLLTFSSDKKREFQYSCSSLNGVCSLTVCGDNSSFTIKNKIIDFLNEHCEIAARDQKTII